MSCDSRQGSRVSRIKTVESCSSISLQHHQYYCNFYCKWLQKLYYSKGSTEWRILYSSASPPVLTNTLRLFRKPPKRGHHSQQKDL